jgi:8-oxo-dGTP pyrophosphatase MutT (NUDIX family)
METLRKMLEGVLEPVAPVRPESIDEKPTPAAVIVPIVVDEGRPLSSEVLFTLRTQAVKSHKGQVSFPGGVIEPGDHDLLETALRETQEETGIAPENFTLAGMLEVYDTLTGFRIQPFIGLLESRPKLALQHVEIEKAFYVPLGFLVDRSHVAEHDISWEGMTLRVGAYKWEDMIIWGATFNILVDFVNRIHKIRGLTQLVV